MNTNDIPLLECVTVEPELEAEGVVIWLHGLGASGHDFEPIVPHLNLPHIRFVFPHAPQLPVTINGGMVMPAWYDIRTISESPDRESEEDIRSAAEQVQALIEREEGRGIPSSRIVLAGFSQGAAMALHVGLRQERPLLGIMVLSGYLVLEDTVDSEWTQASSQVPLFSSHGRRDGVVPHARGHAAFERAARDREESKWSDYPMMHEVCGPQIADIAGWLQNLFGRSSKSS